MHVRRPASKKGMMILGGGLAMGALFGFIAAIF